MRRLSLSLLSAIVAFAGGISLFVVWQTHRPPLPALDVGPAGPNEQSGQTIQPELLPMHVDFKYGFVSRSGEVVVPPQFERASDFSEGLAPVLKGGKWGFIDESGKLVIEPQITDKGSVPPTFKEGRAPVTGFSMRVGPLVIIAPKVGFFDRAGRLVIGHRFDHAEAFSEGLAAVQVDFKWGYIDRAGRFVIPPQFGAASRFKRGVASVIVHREVRGSADGYIDKSGKVFWTDQY